MDDGSSLAEGPVWDEMYRIYPLFALPSHFERELLERWLEELSHG